MGGGGESRILIPVEVLRSVTRRLVHGGHLVVVVGRLVCGGHRVGRLWRDLVSKILDVVVVVLWRRVKIAGHSGHLVGG